MGEIKKKIEGERKAKLNLLCACIEKMKKKIFLENKGNRE